MIGTGASIRQVLSIDRLVDSAASGERRMNEAASIVQVVGKLATAKVQGMKKRRR